MFLTRSLSFLYDGLLSIFYPQSCEICAAAVEERKLGIVCAGCWDQTRLIRHGDNGCWKCGVPSVMTVGPKEPERVRCHRCDEHRYLAARACGLYEGALRASVLRLKREPYVPRCLMELLLAKQRLGPLSTATRIVPVPLHPEREKARGFNQAAVIGSGLARCAGLPLDETSLIRTVHSERHRAGMDAKGRRETVEQAFTVRHPRLIENERILLVDDVFTTGATVSSCAGAMLDAGAQEVFVLTIARTFR